MTRRLLNQAMTFVLYRPKLAAGCVKILRYFPFVNNKLILYADKEGLITPSHAPVPRKGKGSLPEVAADSAPLGSGPVGPISTGERGSGMPVAAIPRGNNHDLKSPLEKWFY